MGKERHFDLWATDKTGASIGPGDLSGSNTRANFLDKNWVTGEGRAQKWFSSTKPALPMEGWEGRQTTG